MNLLNAKHGRFAFVLWLMNALLFGVLAAMWVRR
jgi:hypothetical protein